jgi:dienelactone hydrolase
MSETRWIAPSEDEHGIESMTRRNFLRFGVATCISDAFYACAPCAAGFPPNLAFPVFSGYKDYVINNVVNKSGRSGATGPWNPTPLARVYYPTIDGTAPGAAILTGCEQFPLVLLIHGDCPGVDPYIQWTYFASQLARAGYAVAITAFGGELATGDLSQLSGLQGVHDFMRNSWEYRTTLMPSPNTAVIGHSYGGTLAAELAGVISVKAFVGLSGTFGQVNAPLTVQTLLANIRVPALFLWNHVDDAGVNAEMYNPDSPLPGQMWSFVGTPKHGVVFAKGAHADYLLPGTSGQACSQQGDCNLVRPLAVDLTTTFLTRYLPPQGAGAIPQLVPDSLFVRPQDLPAPPDNGFYAGQYLSGVASSKQVSNRPDPEKQPCFEQLFWDMGQSLGTTYLIPA